MRLPKTVPVLAILRLLPRLLSVGGGLAVDGLAPLVRSLLIFACDDIISRWLATDVVACPDKLTWGVSFDDGPGPYSKLYRLWL